MFFYIVVLRIDDKPVVWKNGETKLRCDTHHVLYPAIRGYTARWRKLHDSCVYLCLPTRISLPLPENDESDPKKQCSVAEGIILYGKLPKIVKLWQIHQIKPSKNNNIQKISKCIESSNWIHRPVKVDGLRGYSKIPMRIVEYPPPSSIPTNFWARNMMDTTPLHSSQMFLPSTPHPRLQSLNNLLQ